MSFEKHLSAFAGDAQTSARAPGKRSFLRENATRYWPVLLSCFACTCLTASQASQVRNQIIKLDCRVTRDTLVVETEKDGDGNWVLASNARKASSTSSDEYHIIIDTEHSTISIGERYYANGKDGDVSTTVNINDDQIAVSQFNDGGTNSNPLVIADIKISRSSGKYSESESANRKRDGIWFITITGQCDRAKERKF